ncbi:MAG: PIN domain-containing protein [Planctomycetes bacterium]|nr:PIN domain-containing protein [Planctomycetota bacterium]
MKAAFADTSYFLALVNPRDQHHAAAREIGKTVAGEIVTTAWVITEFGNAMAHPANRSLFLNLLNDLRRNGRLRMVESNPRLFEEGLDLYARRPDKEWSVTDCISFVVMEEEGLTDALTADHHFEQAGYTVLLK